jgi:hypothetical protein
MPARVWRLRLRGVLCGVGRWVQLAKQLVCGLPLGCDHVCHAPTVAGVLGAFPSVTVTQLDTDIMLSSEDTAV